MVRCFGALCPSLGAPVKRRPSVYVFKEYAAKRFSQTGSGKFKRRRQNLRHILTKKAASRKMRLGQSTLVDQTNEKAVRRMLPNG